MENREDIKSQAVVELLSEGPIKITGNFVVKDLKRDREESPAEILLCRCGRSQNKPYCDDSHKR
jgi:CDGSH iron-sulfur domain-containing protein 3